MGGGPYGIRLHNRISQTAYSITIQAESFHIFVLIAYVFKNFAMYPALLFGTYKGCGTKPKFQRMLHTGTAPVASPWPPAWEVQLTLTTTSRHQ